MLLIIHFIYCTTNAKVEWLQALTIVGGSSASMLDQMCVDLHVLTQLAYFRRAVTKAYTLKTTLTVILKKSAWCCVHTATRRGTLSVQGCVPQSSGFKMIDAAQNVYGWQRNRGN